MRTKLLSAGFVVSLLMLISGCGQGTSQSTEPASKGPEVTKPVSKEPEVTDHTATEPEIVEPKTTEREVEAPEESEPKPPPTLKE